MDRILTIKGKLFYSLEQIGNLTFGIVLLALLAFGVFKILGISGKLITIIEWYLPIIAGVAFFIMFPYDILVEYYTPEHYFTRLDKIHKRLSIVLRSMLMAGGVILITWRIFNLKNPELFAIWCKSFLVILIVPFIFYIIGKYRKKRMIWRIVLSLKKKGEKEHAS